MESIKLFSHVGTDGRLRLEMATNLKDTDVEVVIVVQPLSSESEKRKKRDMTKLIEGFRLSF